MGVTERCDKAFTVGIGPADYTILEIHGVYGAETAGDFIRLDNGLKCSFLVRNCYIAADEFRRGQSRNELRDVLWLNRFLFIDRVDAVFLQPVVVDERRARMGDWPANDTGLFHDGMIPRCLKKPRSGNMGKPRMVK